MAGILSYLHAAKSMFVIHSFNADWMGRILTQILELVYHATINGSIRGWSLCEIMDQAGAGFHKSKQQQRLLFPVEAGQDDYIKEIAPLWAY